MNSSSQQVAASPKLCLCLHHPFGFLNLEEAVPCLHPEGQKVRSSFWLCAPKDGSSGLSCFHLPAGLLCALANLCNRHLFSGNCVTLVSMLRRLASARMAFIGVVFTWPVMVCLAYLLASF